MEKYEEGVMAEYNRTERCRQEKLADKTIRRHVYISLGIGLVPLPFVDFAGVAGTQLNLLRKLSEIYNIPFSKEMIKNILGALIGGAFSAAVAPRLAFSIFKIVPGPGQTLAVAGAAGVSGASTYAIGKVFDRHFAEGGTFLSFDPEKAKAFYEKMFQEGKKVVDDLKRKKDGTAEETESGQDLAEPNVTDEAEAGEEAKDVQQDTAVSSSVSSSASVMEEDNKKDLAAEIAQETEEEKKPPPQLGTGERLQEIVRT